MAEPELINPAYTVASDSEQTSALAGGKSPPPRSPEPAIGIDLGTAFSSAAFWRNGIVEVFPRNEEGTHRIPSQVLFSEEMSMGAVGKATADQICSGSVLFGAKRLIGRTDDDPVVENSKPYWPFFVQTLGIGVKPLLGVLRSDVWRITTPEEVLAIILLQLKNASERAIGKAVQNVVLTMPTSFSRFQQARLERACVLAGMTPLRIMPEPTAAALVYAQKQQREQALAGTSLGSGIEKQVLVFNLGGGHCDVAVATTSGGFCQIKSLAGDVIGGEDIVRGIIEHIGKEFEENGKSSFTTNPKSRCNLRLQCVQAMHTLSTEEEAVVAVPFSNDGNIAAISSRAISRADFDAWNEPIYKRCMELVKRALEDAKVEPDAIDDYILIGGCTNILHVRNMLHKFFGGKAPCDLKVVHDEVVAYGAALEAAIASGISDPQGGLDLLTLQAMPLSLGIGLVNGEFFNILHRNSIIPARRDVIVTTCHDHQSEALIRVYEGENQEASRSHLLGFFLLTGIPPLPKGVPIISICMDVDAADTLRVMAGVYLPDQPDPVVPMMEIRMPTVDDGHGWCIEALNKKFGTSLDVMLPPKAPADQTYKA